MTDKLDIQKAMAKMSLIYSSNPSWKNPEYVKEFQTALKMVARDDQDVCTFVRGALVGTAKAAGYDAKFGEFSCVPDADILSFLRNVILGKSRHEDLI